MSATFYGDGILLYELPREDFVDKFGSIAGKGIYNHLSNSKYGYVRLSLLVNTLNTGGNLILRKYRMGVFGQYLSRLEQRLCSLAWGTELTSFGGRVRQEFSSF